MTPEELKRLRETIAEVKKLLGTDSDEKMMDAIVSDLADMYNQPGEEPAEEDDLAHLMTSLQVRDEMLNFDESTADDNMFAAVLSADPNLTTCTCRFPGSDKDYTYLIAMNLANDAQPGDILIVDHNHQSGYAAVELQSINRIPDFRWGKTTRAVMAVVPRDELDSGAEELRLHKARLYCTAVKHREAQEDELVRTTRLELQHSLGLYDLFNNDEQESV